MKSIATMILAALASSMIYAADQPNILFILADDMRNDSMATARDSMENSM